MVCQCSKCRSAVADAAGLLKGMTSALAKRLWGTDDPVRLAFSKGWLCC